MTELVALGVSGGGFHMASGRRKIIGRTHRDDCPDGHPCVCVKEADVITPHELASMLPASKDPLDILIERENEQEAAAKRNVVIL